MTAHHPRGPSRLPALARCVWNEGKPPGAEAERGTRIHEIIAGALTGGAITLHPGEDDERQAAERALEVAGRELAVVEAVEQLLELRDGDGRVLTFGTVDAYGRDASGALAVLDWKTGSVRDHREQGACYALMAMDATGEQAARVVFAYIDQGSTRAEPFTRAQAEAIVLPILERAEAKAEDPAINPFCSWCARRASCPAWVSPAMTAVAAVDADLAALFAGGLESIKGDPERAGKFLTAWRAAAAVVEDSGIGEAVRSTLGAGGFVPGWKLQQRAGKSSIEAADFLRLLPDLGDEAARFVRVDAGGLLKWWSKTRKASPLPVKVTTAPATTALVAITPGAPGSEE